MTAFFRKLADGIRRCARRVWSRLAPLPDSSATLGLATDACRPRRQLLVEKRAAAPSPHHLASQVFATEADEDRAAAPAARCFPYPRLAQRRRPRATRDCPALAPARIPNVWRFKSRPLPGSALPAPTIDLIRDMAHRNRLWGAERVRGELLKLGIRVSKRTVQKYMRQGHSDPRSGQRWSTFLRNHADETWACDFLQTYDRLFRSVFAFFIVHLGSRRVVHVGTTRCPTQRWTALQLRNATMDGDAPRFVLRDRDDKYGDELTVSHRGPAHESSALRFGPRT